MKQQGITSDVNLAVDQNQVENYKNTPPPKKPDRNKNALSDISKVLFKVAEK
jgi:hypothetical protein